MKRTINEFKLNLYESVINLLSEVNNWKNVKHIADGWIKQQNIALENVKYVDVPNIKYIDFLLNQQEDLITNFEKTTEHILLFYKSLSSDTTIKQFFSIQKFLQKTLQSNTYDLNIDGEVNGWGYEDFVLKRKNTLILIGHIYDSLKNIDHTLYDWEKLNPLLMTFNMETFRHFKTSPIQHNYDIGDASNKKFKSKIISIDASGWNADNVFTTIQTLEPILSQAIKMLEVLKRIRSLIHIPKTNDEYEREKVITLINSNLITIFYILDYLLLSTSSMIRQIVTMFNKIEFVKK